MCSGRTKLQFECREKGLGADPGLDKNFTSLRPVLSHVARNACLECPIHSIDCSDQATLLGVEATTIRQNPRVIATSPASPKPLPSAAAFTKPS
jgi:hypothetical protein